MNKVEKWLSVSESIEEYLLNEKILDTARNLDQKLKDYEFIFYIEGEIDGNRLFFNKEAIIPPQTISPDYVIPYWIPSNGFWGIVHKHPEPFIHFSGLDRIYTSTYPFSICFLWCGGHLVEAMYMDDKIDLKNIRYIKGSLDKSEINEDIVVRNQVELPFLCDKSLISRGLLTIDHDSWRMKTEDFLFIDA